MSHFSAHGSDDLPDRGTPNEGRSHSGEQSTVHEIADGWRTILPAALAAVPLGLALGVLVIQTGLEWWWAPILSAVVFAGSMEFLLLGLVAAGTPLPQIAVSTLLVNFRHAFYALSFPLERVKGIGWKMYGTFALTDEAYAVSSVPEAHTWSRTKIIALEASFHLAWTVCVTAGALLGTLIPPEIKGLDFAATALFIVLAIEGYKAHRSVPIPLIALACAGVGAVISPANMLLISMIIFIACLMVMYVLRGRQERNARGSEGTNL
ncbi:MAG: AzlC family ABC transporter permease [Ancrocorticia sp.]|uniref:AzlC family ABC transporter permease n=1 Tax=Ancrocorticia sp. TaxID=2593684 RepID=UPI003F8F6168